MAKKFLGHCKKCGGTVRLELTGTNKVEERDWHGHVRAVTYTYALPNGERTKGNYERFFAKCLCGRSVEFRAVRGVYSEKKACGARCLSATGPNCECRCAGANHGAGHSI